MGDQKSAATIWLGGAIRAVAAVLWLAGFAHLPVAGQSLASLPVLAVDKDYAPPADWLIQDVQQKSGVFRNPAGTELILTNGLVRRAWRLKPNAATVAFDNLCTGTSLLRGVKPEAVVTLNGVQFEVGGLEGQPDYAYLNPAWLERMTSSPKAFQFVGFEPGKTAAPFEWKRVRYSTGGAWPPEGASVTLRFSPPKGTLPGIVVLVHYEIYDAIPVLAKWVSIGNDSDQEVSLDHITTELLAVVDYESAVDHTPRSPEDLLHVESDYAFGGADAAGATVAVDWEPDPQYKSQVNYLLTSPDLLEVRPPLGPGVKISSGATWVSFRTFELAYDSTDRERKGLAVRRMYRTLAPWATENPIMMHVRNADPKAVREAIDQCADAGFEMAILSFGSGFTMESEDPAYLEQIRQLVAYAHQKKVELGGYSLLASRHISAEDDVINPKTGTTGGARFGDSPCLESRWGQEYFRKLRHFIEFTGMDLLEHDGSYPGDVCASTRHPGHRGLKDSQWTQWKEIVEFYHWCRARGVYLNVPDWYFLNGSSKIAMGYREDDWSLPREEQIILARQNIYDGTWEKTPSMGWMFVPLVQYKGGGAAATYEPLRDHLSDYGHMLADNFGAGVQACYRGPRLFDSAETRNLVKQWVSFYKEHRAILDSDIIHVRRADGRDIDAILHVNPRAQEKGLAVIYNPGDRPAERTLKLPLYYTGLSTTARIRQQNGPPRTYRLDRQFNVSVPVQVPAHGMTWLVIE
jgi:hypothetical protein